MNAPGLGTQTQHRIAAKIVEYLQGQGILAVDGEELFPADAFEAVRKRVNESFVVDESTITPLMARLLYVIAYHRRPRNVLTLGSYMGNALVWLAVPGTGPDGCYQAENVIGVDVDLAANEAARTNFAALGGSGVKIVDGDAYRWVEETDLEFDLVLLDIDEPSRGKRGYLDLLRALEKRLRPGALILAHDIAVEKYAEDLQPYLDWVKEPTRFQKSASLKIDPAGIEVTLR